LTVAGAHTVGAPDGGPGLPGVGWNREHGDLRVAHFIGLHALQILPLVTLAMRRRGWDGTRQVRMVWATAASHFGLYFLLLSQALRGQSIIRPDATAVTAFGTWAVLTATVLWLLSAKSTTAPGHAIVY
jgi:hypothetical protein